MADQIELPFEQGIQSASGIWYKTLQPLGEGGNAAAFLAVATAGENKGIPFALKVFRRISKPEWRDNFLREIAFLKTCNHPAIMRVFDEGTYRAEHPFVVAEYLPKTLESVSRAGSATVVEKISFTLQLLSALAYLADPSRSVVHRDIKPSNIFIKGQSCVLGDFGLLKRVTPLGEEDRTSFRESVGPGMPFRYRTPDLVAYVKGERRLSAASDVYQLGLVVAELFTGKNPQRNADDYLGPVELEPLGPIRGGLAPQLKNLIEQMVEANPDTRLSASGLLSPWQGLLFDAAKRANTLEGRAF